MHLKQFPGCCTMRIGTGFGQTDNGDIEFAPNEEMSVQDIKSTLGSWLNIISTRAALVVTTNDQQHNANQALEECGFLSSDWMSKDQHKDTEVKLWWFPINERHING